MQDQVRGVLVQIRVARRERARWAAFAAGLDMKLSELIRAAVRDRIVELERHRYLAMSSSQPPPAASESASQ